MYIITYQTYNIQADQKISHSYECENESAFRKQLEVYYNIDSNKFVKSKFKAIQGKA